MIRIVITLRILHCGYHHLPPHPWKFPIIEFLHSIFGEKVKFCFNPNPSMARTNQHRNNVELHQTQAKNSFPYITYLMTVCGLPTIHLKPWKPGVYFLENRSDMLILIFGYGFLNLKLHIYRLAQRQVTFMFSNGKAYFLLYFWMLQRILNMLPRNLNLILSIFVEDSWMLVNSFRKHFSGLFFRKFT